MSGKMYAAKWERTFSILSFLFILQQSLIIWFHYAEYNVRFPNLILAFFRLNENLPVINKDGDSIFATISIMNVISQDINIGKIFNIFNSRFSLVILALGSLYFQFCESIWSWGVDALNNSDSKILKVNYLDMIN